MSGCPGPPRGTCFSGRREAGSPFRVWLCGGGWVDLPLRASLALVKVNVMRLLRPAHSRAGLKDQRRRWTGKGFETAKGWSPEESWQFYGSWGWKLSPRRLAAPRQDAEGSLLGVLRPRAHKQGLFEIKLRRLSPSGGPGEGILINLFALDFSEMV